MNKVYGRNVGRGCIKVVKPVELTPEQKRQQFVANWVSRNCRPAPRPTVPTAFAASLREQMIAKGHIKPVAKAS